MTTLKKIPLDQRVADHVRAGILAGRWSDRLPPVRTMAIELEVSPPTVLKAFSRLEREGLLRPAVGRTRRRIAASARQRAAPSGKPTLGILYPASANRPGGGYDDVVHQVGEKLMARGIRVRWILGRANSVKKPSACLRRMVSNDPCDGWLVVSGNRAVC
ncbi:MAG: winged helix-turn-helix domain-containing protein, partial [Verrucomicrobiota bacterium]